MFKYIIALIVAIGTLTGCYINPGTVGPTTAIIGDSHTAWYEADWQTSDLIQEGPLAVEATAGWQYQSSPDWVTTLDPPAQRFVIALGTNNVLQGGWTSSDEVYLNRLIAKAPASSCVVLMTTAFGPGIDAATKAQSDKANGYIRWLSRQDPRYSLADWNAEAPTTGWMNDNIHFNAATNEIYQEVITDAVNAC